MVLHKSKRYKIEIEKHSVIAIEFTKIYIVMDLRLELGYSAYELSFLLGKNDFFVRDVENPSNSKRYNPNDTNYLLLIFNEPLCSIMLPKVEENICHLEIKSYLNEFRKIIYEINIKDKNKNAYKPFKIFEVEDKQAVINTSRNVLSFEHVQSYIDTLLVNTYFDEPKRALDIFESCQANFGADFHPRNMIKVLNFYTNKKSGVVKLNKESRDDFGRTLFISQALVR